VNFEEITRKEGDRGISGRWKGQEAQFSNAVSVKDIWTKQDQKDIPHIFGRPL